MKYFVGLIVFLLLVLAPFSRANTPLCRTALSRIELRLDAIKGPETRMSVWIGEEPAGFYKYKMLSETHAEVNVFIQSRFKRMGLSRILSEAMLRREQSITRVSGLLVLDNLAASGLVWVKRPVTEDECMRAVYQTPFYKMFKKLGFEIDQCSYNGPTSYLQVSMSKGIR